MNRKIKLNIEYDGFLKCAWPVSHLLPEKPRRQLHLLFLQSPPFLQGFGLQLSAPERDLLLWGYESDSEILNIVLGGVIEFQRVSFIYIHDVSKVTIQCDVYFFILQISSDFSKFWNKSKAVFFQDLSINWIPITVFPDICMICVNH